MTDTVGLIAVALLVTGCRPTPGPEALTPAATPEVAEASPTPAPLTRAAAQVLSAECGFSMFDPGYREHAQMLQDAGPTVIPVLTEMVADRRRSVWFVSSAAHRVAQYPLDVGFRQALRGRRDDPRFRYDHGARLGVFRYFVSFGDESDLAWMAEAAETLDKARRPDGDEEIRKLRVRLRQS